MFRQLFLFHHQSRHVVAGARNAFALQGVLLILFGLLIAIAPQILVALVASCFVGLGVLCLIAAWKMPGSTNRSWRSWNGHSWKGREPF